MAGRPWRDFTSHRHTLGNDGFLCSGLMLSWGVSPTLTCLFMNYIHIYIRTFFYMYLWKIFVFLHARSREESNNPFHLLLSHRSKNEFQDTFPSLGKKRVLGSQSDPFKDTLQQSNATIRNPHKMEVFMGKSSINGAFSMAMFDCQWVERQFVNHQSHENQLLMLGKHHWFKHAYQMDPNGKWPDIFLEILHSGAPDLVYVHISSVSKW